MTVSQSIGDWVNKSDRFPTMYVSNLDGLNVVQNRKHTAFKSLQDVVIMGLLILPPDSEGLEDEFLVLAKASLRIVIPAYQNDVPGEWFQTALSDFAVIPIVP